MKAEDKLDRELRVLVVDGVDQARSSLSDLLSELGFSEVRSTASGVEALKLVEQGEVELVIADWSLEELGGLELLKAIRASSDFSSLPVVMTASEQEREHLVEAICEGASSLLILSEDQDEILTSLRLRLESVFKIDPFKFDRKY